MSSIPLPEYFRDFYESFSKGYHSVNSGGIDGAIISKILQNPEAFLHAMSEGKTLSEIGEVPLSALGQYYEKGQADLRCGSYEEAKNCFFFLTALCPIAYDFWMGLALSFFYLRNYEEAIETACFAVSIDARRRDGYLCMARAFCEKKAFTEAISVLEKATAFAKESLQEQWAKELFEASSYAKEKIEKRKK